MKHEGHDKRKRIMICQEEKDRESRVVKERKRGREAQGKNRGKESEVSEGHGRNKHI